MLRMLVYGAAGNYAGTEIYLMTLYKQLDTSKVQFDFLFDHTVDNIPCEEEIVLRGGNIYREPLINRLQPYFCSSIFFCGK